MREQYIMDNPPSLRGDPSRCSGQAPQSGLSSRTGSERSLGVASR